MGPLDFLYGDDEVVESLRERLNQTIEWIRDHQAQYDEMCANWTDVEWLQDAVTVLCDVSESVARHQPDDPARKAVYLLAQARSSLHSVSAQVEFMRDFEARREAMHEVMGKLRAEKLVDAKAG